MKDGKNLYLSDFGSEIRTTWQAFQTNKEFCDVTLSCSDGHIQSHKLIVSQSSLVLKNILKQTSGQNSVIYLTGVKHKYLEKLVTFMYQGEVTVMAEDLGSFF